MTTRSGLDNPRGRAGGNRCPRWAGLLLAGSRDAMLSVRASDAPLGDVIEPIAEAAGLRIVATGLPERRIDIDIPARPLAVILETLLSGESYQLFVPAADGVSSQVPVTLWLFDEGSEATAYYETVLLHGRVGEKKKAIRSLRHLATAAAVESLALALGDDDHRVRNAALEALAAIGGDDALAAIASTMETGQPAFGAEAADALAMAGGPSAIAYLALALGDDDPVVRYAAVDALGDFDGPRARGLLERALADPDTEVSLHAEAVLESIDETSAFRARFPAN